MVDLLNIETDDWLFERKAGKVRIDYMKVETDKIFD